MKKLDPKKNYARWYWQDQVYNMHWYLYTGPSAQKCMDSLLYTLSRDWPWDVGQHGQSLGVCFSIAGTRACMIWTPDHIPGANILVHETFHSMTFLANKMDAKINEDNEEFYAQYQEYLFTQLLDVVKSNKSICEVGKKKK